MNIITSYGAPLFTKLPEGMRNIGAITTIYTQKRDIYRFMYEYRTNSIVIFTGGEDVNPELYGEKNRHAHYNIQRDQVESWVYAAAQEYAIPMLGICRGHQFMCVMAGGTLYQDTQAELGQYHNNPHEVQHTQWSHDCGFYDMMARSNPLGSPDVVNSYHHQAVKCLPTNSFPLMLHADNSIEGILYSRGLSVQEHPEYIDHVEFLIFMRDTFLRKTNDNTANNNGGRA